MSGEAPVKRPSPLLFIIEGKLDGELNRESFSV